MSIYRNRKEIVMDQKNNKNWLDELIKWADANSIPDTKEGDKDHEGNVLGLPRDEREILAVENLFLGENGLDDLPEELPEWLNNLPKLTGLFLNGNSLNSLPVSFGNLRNLKKLNLSDNLSLKMLPDSFAGLSNLTHLHLANTKLMELPECVRELPKLEYLDLSDNNSWLTELPRWLITLPLKVLILSGNRRDKRLVENLIPGGYPVRFNGTSASKESKLLRSLERLDLRGCNLTELRASYFGRLVYLTALDLSDNQLMELPGSMSNLSKLRELYLSSNKFTTLPDSIGDLSELKVLDLSNNELTMLPQWLGKLKNLRKIYVTRKYIKELPPYLSHMADIIVFDKDED